MAHELLFREEQNTFCTIAFIVGDVDE